MSIFAGILTIVVSALIPNLLPIGMFWPISIAILLSAILGVSGKFTALKFSIGIVVGSVVWVGINFYSWAQLSAMLAALQILPTFSAILSFSIAHAFSPVRENVNT